MPNAVSSILRAATRHEGESLNVFCMPTHERFESCFGLTNHTFYALTKAGLKNWNTTYAPLPKNYTILHDYIPIDIDFDVVLSQNKFGQYKIASDFAETNHLPLISLEHTLPHPSWTDNNITHLSNQKGDMNVFLSEYSKDAWGWKEDYAIVGPGIDTEIFTPVWFAIKQPIILSVVNDWINRDLVCGFKLWKEITYGLKVLVLGDTPGLSRAAKDTNELVSAYRQCQIFLNTSLVSTCPFTLLEAMACGSAVVSTATTMIPQIIQDGVNGFCSNNPQILRKRLEELLANPDLCQKIGREARKTIEKKYSFFRMADDWDKVLRKAANIVVGT